MALFCAAYIPDPALKECQFVQVLTKVATNLTRRRTLTRGQPDVDICFLLPFEHERPDFSGMRFHSWRVEQSTLRIEAAVPESMVTSALTETYIIAAIRDAIDNAADFFSEINMPFDRQSFHLQMPADTTATQEI